MKDEQPPAEVFPKSTRPAKPDAPKWRHDHVKREAETEGVRLPLPQHFDPRAMFDRDKREAQGVRCGNCRYWNRKSYRDGGECVRSAPVAGQPAMTFIDHWCGAFERDTSAAPDPPPRGDQA